MSDGWAAPVSLEVKCVWMYLWVPMHESVCLYLRLCLCFHAYGCVWVDFCVYGCVFHKYMHVCSYSMEASVSLHVCVWIFLLDKVESLYRLPLPANPYCCLEKKQCVCLCVCLSTRNYLMLNDCHITEQRVCACMLLSVCQSWSAIVNEPLCSHCMVQQPTCAHTYYTHTSTHLPFLPSASHKTLIYFIRFTHK